MLLVVALGGNALARRGEPLDLGGQRRRVRVAMGALAPIAAQHSVVLTHGNGPQVGLLALQGEAYGGVAPYPLDVLDAETEGMVGYLLEQELGRHLPSGRIATLLTQVVVDPRDPAFSAPTKPVGPVYAAAEGERLAAARGWAIAPDGDGVRRVVPSPEPLGIVELDTIRLLVDAGITVICSGGGGIPVVPNGAGAFTGVEAVIDKDLSAALLATSLGADGLLLLTDVAAVFRSFGSPDPHRVREATVDDLRDLALPAGSMGPKVEAICRFVEAGGHLAAIGALDEAVDVLAGRAGTRVVSSSPARPG